AGLFFVSIGMLVDPGFLVENALSVLVVLALIVPVKGLVVGLLLAAFRLPRRTALMGSLSLAQSAEFSFLLATLGTQLEVLAPTEFSSLIAGAILSVVLLPGLLHLGSRIATSLDRGADDDLAVRPAEGAASEVMTGHAVICGHGRVGRIVTRALVGQGVPVAVLDQDPREIGPLREAGYLALLGSSDNEVLLARASLDRAMLLVVAVPDRASVRRIVRFARQVNPGIVIVARTHELSERQYLESHGVDEAVVGELELALEMARYALRSSEIDPAAVDEYLDLVRHSDDTTAERDGL
ncbi:MAG: NAD-binding protein, partial [Burkholderiaceae bacterium]|nr:NAD-binding protein [Burkholderiaceae bacterium]